MDKKSGPYTNSAEEIWTAAREAIKPFYEIKILDQTKGLLETNWHTLPGVMSGQGIRTKIYISIKQDERGLYFIGVRAEIQHNKNMAPLDHPEALQWESAGTDPDEATRFLERIYILLLKPPAPK